jgi:Fur family transcriptional regulator, ferric uptake regulator
VDDCGYDQMPAVLATAGIEPTPLRLAVVEVLARADQALAAADILERVRRRHRANKVTLYRILDLFVDRGLAGRHSLGERAFRYCLGTRFSRHPHCHVHCVRCGRTLCLPVGEGLVDLSVLGAALPMDVTGVEVRIDGVCPACYGTAVLGTPAVDADRRKT